MPRGVPQPFKVKRRFTDLKPLKPFGDYHLSADHEALRVGRTIYRMTIKKPLPGMRVLIEGKNQRKLGSKIVKGPWSGMPIYALTLQERATCPRSCAHWGDCYGNAMRWSKRWKHGANLEAALEYDLAALERKHPLGFAVRLHILGDFYSLAYVGFWRAWLEEFTGLHVWGYTARTEQSKIGRAIDNLNRDFRNRFVIRRSSDTPGAMRATVISRMPESTVVREGIVCPAETGKTECCGTCGLCWSPSARKMGIVFVRHGLSRGRRKKEGTLNDTRQSRDDGAREGIPAAPG